MSLRREQNCFEIAILMICLIQVTKLLDEESIEWSEENRGTVLIKLNGWREFSFLDADSDSDSD